MTMKGKLVDQKLSGKFLSTGLSRRINYSIRTAAPNLKYCNSFFHSGERQNDWGETYRFTENSSKLLETV